MTETEQARGRWSMPGFGNKTGRRNRSGFGDHLPFAIFLLLMVAVALLGGSSRATVDSLALLRPILGLGVAALLLLPPAARPLVSAGPLLGLLGAFAIVIALQLLPLPPAIWISLPGHQSFAQVALLGGQPQPWRPVSLVPILTVNSLMALLTPLAILVALTRLSIDNRGRVVLTLIVLGVASAVLGLVQVTAGDTSAAYLYAYAYKNGLATGFFANHNHQGVFLASLLPLLAFWSAAGAHSARKMLWRRWIAAAIGFFLLISVVLSGSRSGLAVTVVELLAALWLMLRTRSEGGVFPRWAVPVLVFGACLLVLFLGLASGHHNVFDRLQDFFDPSYGRRKSTLPVTLQLVKEFFISGSGFGTFDPVFRAAEPDALLAPSYFNNAHNDLLELAITGGIPALLVLLALVGWLGLRVSGLISNRSETGAGTRLIQQAGLFMLVAFLLGSLTDYPLRTPFAAAFFTIGCALLSDVRRREKEIVHP
jgi:O-antigen ligase